MYVTIIKWKWWPGYRPLTNAICLFCSLFVFWGNYLIRNLGHTHTHTYTRKQTRTNKEVMHHQQLQLIIASYINRPRNNNICWCLLLTRSPSPATNSRRAQHASSGSKVSIGRAAQVDCFNRTPRCMAPHDYADQHGYGRFSAALITHCTAGHCAS